MLEHRGQRVRCSSLGLTCRSATRPSTKGTTQTTQNPRNVFLKINMLRAPPSWGNEEESSLGNGRAERQKWIGARTPFLDDTTCPSHQGLVLVLLSEKLFNTKNYSADNLAPEYKLGLTTTILSYLLKRLEEQS